MEQREKTFQPSSRFRIRIGVLPSRRFVTVRQPPEPHPGQLERATSQLDSRERFPDGVPYVRFGIAVKRSGREILTDAVAAHPHQSDEKLFVLLHVSRAHDAKCQGNVRAVREHVHGVELGEMFGTVVAVRAVAVHHAGLGQK